METGMPHVSPLLRDVGILTLIFDSRALEYPLPF